jgi:hypothetical protein
MEKWKELLVVVKSLRWYTIIVLFLAGVIYSFHTDIKRLIELKWSETDVVISSLENDLVIERALKTLLNETNSDRAYIFRFHNGVTYYNGTHKSKMSNDYEVVREGVTTQAEALQDLPTSLYLNWIKIVINMEMFVTDINTMEDLRVKYMLQKQGVEAIAVVPYYRDGKLFALIGVDYIRKQTTLEVGNFISNSDAQKNKFLKRTQEIGDLLL